MTSWKGLFNMAVDENGAAIRGSIYSWKALLQALAVLVGHVALFFGIAWYVFRRKDILS
jgi:ABC-type transport system involved in multi-copper enzyme maturation permease subunit